MASSGKQKEKIPDKCPHCSEVIQAEVDEAQGLSVCPKCGQVLEESALRVETELMEQPVGPGRGAGGTQFGPVGVLVRATEAGGGLGSIPRPPVAGHMRGPRMEGDRQQMAKNEATKFMNVVGNQLHLNQSETEQECSNTGSDRWRCGRWAEMVVASCVYVVCRLNKKPYTLIDVAAAVQTNVFTLGRVFTKVLALLNVNIPVLEPELFIERAVAQLPKIDKEKRRTVVQDSQRLVTLAKKDFIVTGRRAEAIAAAAILLACEANGIDLEDDDNLGRLATALHVGRRTVQDRKKEMNKLVLELAKTLPWAKEVTPSALKSFVPFVIRHLDYLLQAKDKEVEGESDSDKSKTEPPLPPSFTIAVSSRKRRAEKVERAKTRLERLLSGNKGGTDNNDDNALDEEDLLIERLLLRGAPETALLEGHYAVGGLDSYGLTGTSSDGHVSKKTKKS